MGEITTRTNNSNILVTDYDTSKLLLGRNTTKTDTYENATGAELTLVAGTVLDRVTATGKIIAFNKSTGGNNKKPIGILIHDVVIAIGGSAKVTFAVEGDVAADKVVFHGVADTLTDVVAGQTIGDLITAWTAGVKCITVTELSELDN
jgi:hypothetical protein